MGVAVAAVLLTGCAGSDTPSPSGSDGTVATPTPTTAPTSPPVAAPSGDIPETCEDLVDDATEAEFAAMGYELSTDYDERAAEQGWPTLAFVTYGGLLCQWGVPVSDGSTVYGYSPITPEQATAEKARLLASGSTTRDGLGGELYELVHEYGMDHYLFTDGSWYHSTSGEKALAEMLTAVEG
jgi:hypothetical protein